MTQVTFEWTTAVDYREYRFWRKGQSSNSTVVNVPTATYDLEPGAYDMTWRVLGGKGVPVKLRIYDSAKDLRLIDRKTTSSGTNGGPSGFTVT